MNLKDAVIVVTGGAGEFGAFIIEHLESKGAVVISFDRKEDNRENSFQLDLTNSDEIETAVNQILTTHQKIDVLINNAGFIYSEPLVNILNRETPRHSLQAFRACLEANLTTSFLTGSHVVEAMIKKRTKGVIINMSSISASGNAGQTAYSAAKAGVIGMTKTWAKELGAFGIRSVAIAPGFIDTGSTHSALTPSIVDHIKKNTPLRKLGTPDSICESISYIIQNDFISGEVINVDGGLTL